MNKLTYNQFCALSDAHQSSLIKQSKCVEPTPSGYDLYLDELVTGQFIISIGSEHLFLYDTPELAKKEFYRILDDMNWDARKVKIIHTGGSEEQTTVKELRETWTNEGCGEKWIINRMMTLRENNEILTALCHYKLV